MKIVVVGGVAAGMSTAARARRLDEDAEIIVFEKAKHVSFANCGLPYHIGEVIEDRASLLLQTPDSLRDALNLDVRIHHKVLAIDRHKKAVTVRDLETGHTFEETYDALALCPGAEPLVPPVPGVDLDGVHVLRRIGDMDRIKARVDGVGGHRPAQHAVVIGAGYIGLEMAENLVERGLTVEVVERSDQIMPPLDPEMTTGLADHIRDKGVALRLETSARGFRAASRGGLRVDLDTGESLRTDLVVLSVGVRPKYGLAESAGLELGPRGGIKVDSHMRTSDAHIWAAGDAVEVEHLMLPDTWLIPLAGPANRQGRVAAENIVGRDSTFTAVQGSSVVQVFDMVAGGTGATQKQLEATGESFDVVNLHPSGHAGYYPGSRQMNMKVLFHPENGRLLGAQIVGFDGVDKRLDVLATALRARMTMFDLEDLELAYAPPFGSAKDPVNMAGFIASNVVRGDLRLWHARDWPANTEGARLIDVRTPGEYELWHIPGAVNVPLATVRDASADWDRKRRVLLYCAVGFRSYLAYRALVQRGFADVATLSGGSLTFRSIHDVGADASVSDEPIVAYAEGRTAPAGYLG